MSATGDPPAAVYRAHCTVGNDELICVGKPTVSLFCVGDILSRKTAVNTVMLIVCEVLIILPGYLSLSRATKTYLGSLLPGKKDFSHMIK